VIAQCDRGAVQVLAAFVSEGMGLRRHVETVVKPWLLANARWALYDSRLLLGTYEDITDAQSENDFTQTLDDTLGGCWEKTASRWESRRDSVLELIGESVPGLFKPKLRIDPGAKLLVEALSGRWSYEKDRRSQQTSWHHVANAFSLLASNIEPQRAPQKITVLASLDKEHFDATDGHRRRLCWPYAG